MLQGAVQSGLALAPVKYARGVAIIRRRLVPFRGISDDAGPVFVPALEHHFADRKSMGGAVFLEQRDVELAPFDVAFGKPAAAMPRGGGLRAGCDSFASGNDRAVVEAKGSIFARRLHDPAPFADVAPMRRL